MRVSILIAAIASLEFCLLGTDSLTSLLSPNYPYFNAAYLEWSPSKFEFQAVDLVEVKMHVWVIVVCGDQTRFFFFFLCLMVGPCVGEGWRFVVCVKTNFNTYI
jgi:hypothetical protein